MSAMSASSIIEFFKGSTSDNTSRRLLRQDHSNSVKHGETLEFQLVPEAFRFAAYVAFWLMTFFAILVTNLFTRSAIMKGPKDAGNACPPFDDGVGFDIVDDSHIMRMFHFNNISVNWHYSPSREWAAFIFPLFEYCLLIYLSLDFLDSWVAFKKGYVSHRFFRIHCLLFPLTVFLCSQFRMIFVVLTYENVQGHMTGFLCLQLALVIVAIYNFAYALETGIIYKPLRTLTRTRQTIWVYVISDLLISVIKICLSFYVVLIGSYPSWATKNLGGKPFGKWIDIFWMLLNAVLPVFVSFNQASTQVPLMVTIDQTRPIFVSAEEADNLATQEETTRLT